MSVSKLSLVPFGSDAIGKLRQSIIDGKSGDSLNPVTVIVPNQYAGISLRRALSSQTGLVNVRFMVLPRLAEYLGSPKLASEGRIPMTPLVELAAIREAGGVITGEGPLIPLTGHPLLHSSLSRSFRQLDHLTEDRLDELKGIDCLRGQIVDWHHRFLELTNDFYSEGMLFRAATEAVGDGSADAALRDLGFIIFYMIQDLSLSERPLIEQLARLDRSALILGLSGETGPDTWARELAAGTAQALGPADEMPPPQQLFGVEQIVSAPDAQEEVRWTVRHIIKQAEDGCRFSRMAVLYHQGGPYESLIASQFGLAGIPIAGPSPIPLSDTPAGRLILLFMNVLDSGYSRESIMQWISESPVRPRIGTSFTSAQAAEWDLISRNAGIVGGLDQWTGRLKRYVETIRMRISAAEDVEESTPAKLQGLRQLGEAGIGLLGFISRLPRSTPPPPGSPWMTYVDWAKRLLTEHGPDLQEWSEQSQSGFERVCEVLEDIRGLDVVSDTTDLDGFRSVLEDALQVSAGRIGATGTGVLSASVATAVSMDLDHVYILGMAEGGFPRAGADDPMLPEEVCEAVGDGGLFISREHFRMRDRREFLAALACAERRFVTYPRTDPSAQRGQHPSPWFLELAGRMNRAPVTSTDLPRLRDELWMTWIDSSEDGLRTAHELAYADGHDYDVDSVSRWRGAGQPLNRHYLAEDQGPLDRCLALEAGRESTELSAWDGGLLEISSPGNSFLEASSAVFSATRLERWSVCPYRYFLGDVLGLSALEAPEELLTISPLDRGTLVHRILERFVRSVIETDDVPDAGQSWTTGHRSLLSSIAEEEFADAEVKGITGRPLLWNVSKEELMADLEAFLESDDLWRSETGCRPVWVERRFGFEDDPESLPPVILKLDNSLEIRLRGVIDRVDIDPAGRRAVITDYKTGRSTAYRDMNKDPLGGGRHLQLPVYAIAVRDALGGLEEVDSQYWFISTAGRFEHKVVSLTEVEEGLSREAGRMVSAISQGIFPAIPGPPDQSGGPQNCRYCEFDKICPSNRDVLWDRKQGSPLIQEALGQYDDEGESDETAE